MTQKLKKWQIRQHYEKPRIKNRIMQTTPNREIAPRYHNGSYGKRPDQIQMKGDLNQLIQNGAAELHASVEHWKNPLLIEKTDNPDHLRTGWDLIIDIDCDKSFKLAKQTAQLIIKELENHGIQNIGAKFSGNRGFHLGIKKQAFPTEINNQKTSNLYPQLPKQIITYLRHQLKPEMTRLVKKHGYTQQIQTPQGPDPYQISDIENGWSHRHLFRLPYTIHTGSGLVSLPIKPRQIPTFQKKQAKPQNVIPRHPFLPQPEPGEAEKLVQKTLQHTEKQQKKDNTPNQDPLQNPKNHDTDYQTPENAAPEKHFPPTIKKILQGLQDGRKRALFILIKFLRTVGWNWKQTRKRINQWNTQNQPPLKQNYIQKQIQYHKNKGKKTPPPNYNTKGYYKDIGVQQQEAENYTNPAAYTYIKTQNTTQQTQKQKQQQQEEETNNKTCPICLKTLQNKENLQKHRKKCAEQQQKHL